MDQNALVVDWVSPDDLFENPSNPRHNEPAVPHVAASIRRFGWQQPIVARPSGEIVAGHTRLKAARELGMDRVPVVRFEGTDLDAAAYNVADNKTHEFAEWNEPALAQLLEELRAEDSLEGTGFSSEDLDALLDEIQADLEADGEVVQDVPPALPDDATTRTGDLWILGSHRLLCGDSTQQETVQQDRWLERCWPVLVDVPMVRQNRSGESRGT